MSSTVQNVSWKPEKRKPPIFSTSSLPEIAAPAGNQEMLTAAVRCGADAVYLGLQRFSARAFAENFHIENLQQTVGYCHARGVRVFVALNTLVYNRELDDIVELIQIIARSGVDAVIIQDMAILTLARAICPELPLHASTQCSALTPSAVRQLGEFGFKRVVIGREAELDTITQTAKDDTQLEVFVHGALCYSVSGACYMSAFLGGRSANRGSCASPCRLPYKLDDTKNFDSLLSLRDLCNLHNLPLLAKIGVHCAKIEGRMRTPEYVACAVDCAVKGRAGEPFDLDTLTTAFSHGGFTEGRFGGKGAQDMFGARTERDGDRTRELLPKLRELYRNERQSVPVDAVLKLEPDSLFLEISCGDIRLCDTVEVKTEPTERDQSVPLENAIRKTGGTPFFIDRCELLLSPGIFVPSREVANLRRQLLEKLLSIRSEVNPYSVYPYTLPSIAKSDSSSKRNIRLRVSNVEQLQHIDSDDLEFFQVPAEELDLLPTQFYDKTIVEISRGCTDVEADDFIKKATSMGIHHFSVDNPSHLALCPDTRHGGFGLNVTNYLSFDFYKSQNVEDVILSVEISATDCARFGENAGVVGYGHIPLMLSAVCREGIEQELIDRKGRHLSVVKRGDFVEILNAVPLYVGDRKEEFSVDFFLLYMTGESPERVALILEIFKNGKPFDSEYTRGLYY